MFMPVSVDIRKRAMLPIVEVRATSFADPRTWIQMIFMFIEKGEKKGGRLFTEPPDEVLKVNTIYFAMIFGTEESAMEYVESLRKG